MTVITFREIGESYPSIAMQTILVYRDEVESLRELQIKKHREWPAVFSTNGKEIWPYVTDGFTHIEWRQEVGGECTLVDEVADAICRARPEGGRFFIDERGAFYRDMQSQIVQFVVFEYLPF